MDNLYDKVNKQEQKKKARRRDPWVIVLLTVVLILLIGIGLAICYWFYVDSLYDDYVADLSNSTVTINEAKLLPIIVEGDDNCYLNTITAYGLYNKLTVSKQIRVVSDCPDDYDSGIHINYIDGSRLDIWYTDINISTWSRQHGIAVRYTDQDGNEFCYITDRVVYADLVYYLSE